MDGVIKVGLGIMIKDGDKVLLGHRSEKYGDTGGIYEPESWTFPGGKQEYNETIIEGAIRETKEETNLDISDLEIFNAVDDIQPSKHYITIQLITNKFSGELINLEPNKHDQGDWFRLDNLPSNLYTPTRKFIQEYLNRSRKCK